MTWLGYTVTYGSEKKSDNIRWIRYNDWMKVEDLILSNSITWYTYEGRNIKLPRKSTNFENVVINENSKPDSFYARPENAKVIVKTE